MKKYSNLIIIILSFSTLFLILCNKSLVSRTIITSFSIWFNTLVPSMFPMFILSDILINYNFTMYIPKRIINFISKIFNISNSSVLIIFLSMISGFPTNAINIRNAYDNNMISKKEAEHLLLFNHFANPLFILETVGTFYLNNNKYGIIILLSLILGSIIIGILFRNKNHSTPVNYISKNDNCQSFGTALSEAIKKSINSLLMISGTVTLFLVLSTLVINIFHLNSFIAVLIQGILEMTMATSLLSSLNISDLVKVVCATSIIAFGGLSIHLQVISILDDKIRYRNYFIGRLLHAIISGLIVFIIMILI